VDAGDLVGCTRLGRRADHDRVHRPISMVPTKDEAQVGRDREAVAAGPAGTSQPGCLRQAGTGATVPGRV
jgi:hypothetical protein